ncbi:hypothetical protein KGF56_001300 [Candida oxycetoniae]|uniref:Uncharacterized protein n=1 Tax=Candida oxycetoniae TaxID=497107 RepID=A0AAI9SZJ0_9ASCO|nr:uncharacterized protein KGF56_001300 [Candida oxycetoniae]KAI3406081.1 hypothetical protein KGF56_001300 [Candida oxycetoniae]
MVLLNIRTFIFGLIVFYTSYLYNYKCPSLTPIEKIENKVLHPLSSQHSVLCDLLHGGVNKVEPYVFKAHTFLDEHVHSHPLFIKYKIHDKFLCAQDKFKTYVYPRIYDLYEFTDSVEAKSYDQLSQFFKQANEFVYGKLKKD